MALSLALAGCGGGGLSQEDQRAYDYVEKAADGFKDPSSVRILGGAFYSPGEDSPDQLCAGLSATNGYGARTTGYYIIYEDGSCQKVEADTIEFALTTDKGRETMGEYIGSMEAFLIDDAFDYDALNEKLDEKWKSFN